MLKPYTGDNASFQPSFKASVIPSSASTLSFSLDLDPPLDILPPSFGRIALFWSTVLHYLHMALPCNQSFPYECGYIWLHKLLIKFTAISDFPFMVCFDGSMALRIFLSVILALSKYCLFMVQDVESWLSVGPMINILKMKGRESEVIRC